MHLAWGCFRSAARRLPGSACAAGPAVGPLGDPVSDPFAADLKEGSVSWTGGFDYISIKNGTRLSVFSGDGGAFELDFGVSNIKVWNSSSAIPEPTAALVFATGFAVMGIARRRVA